MASRRTTITERDQELLRFLARHRLVRTDHVQALLEVSGGAAGERLRRLRDAGLVKDGPRFAGQPQCWQITGQGLAAAGVRMRAPRRDLSELAHDVGAAWLWLAARDGAFGRLRELHSERELRSLDGPGRRAQTPLAVRVGGVGPRGGERRHYPDLLLVTERGERVALELELTSKARTRRELILSAYGGEPAIDHVVYLVRDRRVGEEIAGSARKLGLQNIVHVQRVTLPDPTRPTTAGRVAQRTRGLAR